jgi:hypothetical protein
MDAICANPFCQCRIVVENKRHIVLRANRLERACERRDLIIRSVFEPELKGSDATSSEHIIER